MPLFILAAAASAALATPQTAPADEDAVCLIVISASIDRARRQPNLPPDQQETVRSWETAMGLFSGAVMTRFGTGAPLATAIKTASAEADRRDPYRATVDCDARYRTAMKALQAAFKPS